MNTSPSAEIQSGTQIRAGLYLRISRDRAQLRLAVRRQEEDCRQVAERLGWVVAGVYVDNGFSASRFATKPRNDYRRLLEDITAGMLDAVVVWVEDRSHRQVTELAEFLKTCRTAGISRYASLGTEYDLSDPDQVMMLLCGIPAPRGGLWTRRTLKIVLTHPRVAGLRQHQGTIVGEADWPAILDHSTWERVRLTLLSPDRGSARTASRNFLLIRDAVFSLVRDHLEPTQVPGAGECIVVKGKLGGRPTPLLSEIASGEDVHQAWESASQAVRRELIDALVERIVVLPQIVSTFDPNSIQVIWRIGDQARQAPSRWPSDAESARRTYVDGRLRAVRELGVPTAGIGRPANRHEQSRAA